MTGRIRYCHNKSCDVYNQGQSDNGFEEQKNWKCFCGTILTKKNERGITK